MHKRLREIIRNSTPQLEAVSDADASWKQDANVWSPKEILGHLVDSAMHNHERFVGIALNEKLEFAGDDQNAWVNFQAWQDRPWLEIVALWNAYNLHIAWLIEQLPENSLEREATVFLSRKTVTLKWLVEHYVQHLEHHLGQINERIRQIQ